jgi:large-conductance mechanosensitive channel
MENQASSKSIILNYGLYLGIASVLISLVNYAAGDYLKPHWSVSILSGILMIAMIVFAFKKFKEINSGFMSWGQAVKIGVGVTVVSAVISIVYQQLFQNFIEPEYMQQMMMMQEQAWTDAGMNSEGIDAAKEMMQKFQGPLISSAIGLVVAAFVGFVVAAITGAIMKQSAEEQY